MYFSENSNNLQAFGIVLVFEAFLEGKRRMREAERARDRAVGAADALIRKQLLRAEGFETARDRIAAREISEDVKASWEYARLCELARELLPPDLLRELHWEARWI